ncbi:MAG: hypothetical protein ACREMN_11550 [Gemmatimonadales bacterium]
MSTDQKMLNCKSCGKPTLHLVQRPNHILHLLLSVFTAGLWLIVWVLVSMGEKKASCTVCGTRYKRRLFESV